VANYRESDPAAEGNRTQGRALFTHNEVSFVLDKVTPQHLDKGDLTVVEGGVEVIKFAFERNCHVLQGIGRP
jgi:hypothetical protein